MGNDPSSFKGENLPVETVSWMLFRSSSRSSIRKKVGTNTGFQLRRNGNTQRVQEQKPGIPSAMMNQSLAIMHGMKRTQEIKLMRLALRNPISGFYTICTATSGNGCRISGMEIMTAPQQMEVPGKVEMVRPESFVAAAGGIVPEAAGRRFATPALPATAAPLASSAFTFSGFCNHFLLYYFTTYHPSLLQTVKNTKVVLACDRCQHASENPSE